MTEAVPHSRLWAPLALGVWAAVAGILPARYAVLALAPALAAALIWWCLLEPHRWVMAFFCAALLLPPLPFALGDSGPHPALALAALGLWIAFLRARGPLPPVAARFGPSGAVLLFFAVLLASVAEAAVYSGMAIAAGSLARVLLFGISVLVFLYTAGTPDPNHWRATRVLFAVAVAAALFACVDFYYQLPAPAGFGPQFVWTDTGVYRRAQGLFYEASTLGNFCAFFIVMIAVALVRPRAERPVARGWLLAGGAVLACALVLSYSRASILNVGIAVAVLLWTHRQRFSVGRALAIVSVSLAAAAGAGLLAFPVFARLSWDRFWLSIYYFFSLPEAILSGRLASWRELADFLGSHPWHVFFGVGYKTLPYSDYTGRPVVADNMYLSLLVETGVVGLAAMLLFNFAILRAGWRASRHPDGRTSFYGAWIFCFWCGQMFQMLSGDLLTYWRVLPVYFWVLAVAVREFHADPVR